MKSSERFDAYVAKAKDAETRAEQAKSEAAQETWRRIAATYRDLAMMEQAAQRKRRKRPL